MNGDVTSKNDAPPLSAPKKALLLVGCRLRGESSELAEESLAELNRLAATAGATKIHAHLFDVFNVRAGTFIGKGQLDKVRELADDKDIDVLVFDCELSPVQQRNIEAVTERMVMDRTGIILDIFASRARSSEGKLQVELAQLDYLLPRLRGMWTHLSRQGAGIGTRGPGETVLEVDRRRIKEKMRRIKKDLVKVSRTRELHRNARTAVPYPTATLVGYTNAGKSTLMNLLTKAGVLVEDKLFATLDPTVRELRLPGGDRLLLADTVGFIRKLPHQLVKAFSATFEEIQTAQILLHLVDASHSMLDSHIEATRDVFFQIGVDEERVILVLNKIDQIEDPGMLAGLKRSYPDGVFISAITRRGVDDLLEALSAKLSSKRLRMEVFLPYADTEMISKVKKQAKILESDYQKDGIWMSLEAEPRLAHALEDYRT